MPSKRPQGLNKAAKNKKQKVAPNENNGPEKDQTPDFTIALEDEVDPDDELAQLYGLYETYRESSKDSPKLLYGLVHECDRLLRNSTEKLPSRFHNIYAISLLDLAKFVETEDDQPKKKSGNNGESCADFILAAIERASIGIEESSDSIADLYFTLSRAKLALVDEKLKNSPSESRYDEAINILPELKEAVSDFETAEKFLLESGKSFLDFSKDQLGAVEDLLQIVDGFIALEDENEAESDPAASTENIERGRLRSLNDKYLEWSKDRYQRILETSVESKGKNKDPNGSSVSVVLWANRGMGQYYLALAAPLLAKLDDGADEDEDEDDSEDEDEDEDDNDESIALSPEELQSAKDLVQKAVDYLFKAESDDDPETYTVVAEALISLANLFEVESDDQRRLYSQAVLRLRKAQRLGFGSYQELIADLED
ncbi:Ett1p [Sugiyamaella lignohabitans]|uniref:Enhancer of translation termination 1 n=1 Tax=Sugiyamaella lignohabitans TaxID=796027 RepID=A0A161HNQ4_9ASCO|nr:Ett1p [Sugiyamaella lignohabitans]ANB15817.1 Ett1p [Sugiyamaella lignohabitans]